MRVEAELRKLFVGKAAVESTNNRWVVDTDEKGVGVGATGIEVD